MIYLNGAAIKLSYFPRGGYSGNDLWLYYM